MYRYLIGFSQDTLEFKKLYISLIKDRYKQICNNGLCKLNSSILTSVNNEFWTFGDVNSIINYLYYSLSNSDSFYNSDKVKYYSKLMDVEIKKYLKNKYDKSLVFNKGYCVRNTNINLSNEDLNPLNQIDIHPDHNGIGIGWGKEKKENWYLAYDKTLEYLEKIDKNLFKDINLILKK